MSNPPIPGEPWNPQRSSGARREYLAALGQPKPVISPALQAWVLVSLGVAGAALVLFLAFGT